MVPYLRYENLCVKNVNNGDQARFIVGATMLIRTNIRVNVEGRIYTKNEPQEATGGEIKDDDQIAFRLDWAF